MKLLSKLLLLSLANISIAFLLSAHHPQYSGISMLRMDMHGIVYTDSSRFIEQALVVVDDRLPLYSTLFFQQHVKFIYPTSSLLVGSAAHILHVPVGTVINWLILISVPLTFLIAGDVFLVTLADNAIGIRGGPLAIRFLIASLGVFFYPLLLSIGLGQVQTFLTFLFTLSVWFWIRGEKAAAGICLAFICVFKPPLVLFLLWAVLRRQWPFFWSFAAMLLLIQIVSGFLYGWRNEFGYLAVLNYLNHHGEIIIDNQSINGLLERMFRNGGVDHRTDTSPYPSYNVFVYTGTLISSVVFLLFGLVTPVLRRWQATPSDFVLFGLIATIATPIVWTHHYGSFYIGSVYFLAVSLKQNGRIPYSFALCFLTLANLWNILGRLQARVVWMPLFTYDLFAGLGIILLITFSLNHTKEANLIPPLMY
jgi:hypothetical protein